MIHTITSVEDQAIALVGHHFPREEELTSGQQEAVRQHQHVFINTIDEDEEDSSQEHNYTNWEMLLAATSFQAGNMSLPDFRKLQEEDEYCKKVKAMAANDSISKQFHIRQGILLRIYNPGQVDPNRRKIRPPTIVLPASLVDMIIDSEHVGPLSAHLSAKRVYLTLREKYHFPNMEARVNARVKQCLPCQLNMHTTQKSHKLHMTCLLYTSPSPRD